MKRLIVAAAALALAACADTNPLAEPHTAGSPRKLVYGSPETIFTTQTPASTLDGAGEVATRFYSASPGRIVGFRFWKAEGETGTHTIRLWSGGGTEMVRKTLTSESASGWQTVYISAVNVGAAPRKYTVSVNVNSKHVKTFGVFGSWVITNDWLTADMGFYGTAGTFPNTSSSSNFFVDVIFEQLDCDPSVETCPAPGG